MSDGSPPKSPARSTQSPTQSPTMSTQSPSQVKSHSQTGSSSSSAPTSSSQSSGTVSSVDTIPVTLPSVPEEPEPQPWGRLLPMARGFRALDCLDEEYLFGRDTKCHYVLGDSGDQGSKRFLTYSKKHFRIYKDDGEVFVQDLSNNGTFVDGVKVGKNKKLPLVNNAVLALSEVKNRVFVFIHLSENDQSSLPADLQDKYLLTRRIGTGVCGEVKLAFERSTCKKFAVKIIEKKNFKSEGTATRNAETELEILQRVDHPCLIKTEDFYQTDDCYFIVLELMEGGELFQRVKSQQLQEPIAKLFFYQMLRAVEYLHSQGIIHRDLKPENILLSSNDDVCLIKLTDFNQSRILDSSALMRTLCGTPSYLAPEVFTHATTTGYSGAVDCWSLGVVLFVCLGGYPPFHENFGECVTDQIVQGQFTMIPSKWRHVSKQAKDVVRKLLVVDPDKRMTITDALQHPWLQDQQMIDQAHKLMYQEEATMDVEETAVLRKRKRNHDDDDDESERPAKQAPPPHMLTGST